MSTSWFVGLTLVSFAAMEVVSYAAHRWLMHGPGMAWHASHHAPPRGRFEKNDLFPLVFSAVGVLVFVGAAAGVAALWPIGLGVTLYGLAYLMMHDIAIHRRLPCGFPTTAYVRRLRRAHADHHRTGGEPYGMLLPVRRRRVVADEDEDEGRDVLVRRVVIRRTRSRL